MGIIFLFSALPANKLPSLSGWFDIGFKKGGHFFAYGILASLYLMGIDERHPRSISLAWGLATLYAISDEFHQSFVPGRFASILDVGIDALGAFSGLMVFTFVSRTLRTSQERESANPER